MQIPVRTFRHTLSGHEAQSTPASTLTRGADAADAAAVPQGTNGSNTPFGQSLGHAGPLGASAHGGADEWGTARATPEWRAALADFAAANPSVVSGAPADSVAAQQQ